MKKYTISTHLIEIKKRILVTIIFFIATFLFCYIFHNKIFHLFLDPLTNIPSHGLRKIIYTGLTEAFISHIKLSMFSAFFLTFPMICYQVYSFVAPGLLVNEKKIVTLIFFFSPMLFYTGVLFAFYVVTPRAWAFFLSYESNLGKVPIILEPKISEYLDLLIQFMVSFGVAFQLPVVLVILGMVGILRSHHLQSKRRISTVIIFILSAVFTPPDVMSQIILAMPLLLLYELSIVLCRLVEKKGC